MKCVFMSLIVASVMVLTMSQGIPIKFCPPGEHSVLYCPSKAEPTCDKPYIHEPEVPLPCDKPECFCDQGTIRDTRTNKCVPPQECESNNCTKS